MGIASLDDGSIDICGRDAIIGAEGTIKTLPERKWAGYMSQVDQEPGDWIWFVNHPFPAIHAVTASRKWGTESLVTTYATGQE
jgi:hypothetical protein